MECILASSSLWQGHAAAVATQHSPTSLFLDDQCLASLATDSRSIFLLGSCDLSTGPTCISYSIAHSQGEVLVEARDVTSSRARYSFWQLRAATARCIIRMDRAAFCYICRFPDTEGRCDRACNASEVDMVVDESHFFDIFCKSPEATAIHPPQIYKSPAPKCNSRVA